MELDYKLYSPSYRLPCLSTRITYGVGNIINDLTAVVFRNFALFYLVTVAQVQFAHAGYAMLAGQVVSALSSLLADRLGQRCNAFCCCYSKRKSWHLIGTVLVVVGFLLLFMQNLAGEHLGFTYKAALYYGGFIVVFQLGWSFVQSAHLGLIPEITRNPHERIELSAIRYTVGIVGQIVVFAIMWLLFSLSKDNTIGPADIQWFRTLAITVVATGFGAAAVFHIGTDEIGYDVFEDNHLSLTSLDHVTSCRWTKEPQYYQVVFLHMFTRISSNVAVMYLPLFVGHTLGMNKTYLVMVPFVAHLGSTFAPLALRPLAHCASAKVTYVVGVVLVGGVALWAWFVRVTWPELELQTFCMGVLLGAGGAVTSFSSLTIAQAVVGQNTDSGGFVFTSMSLVDRLMTGIAVLVINQLKGSGDLPHDQLYYRYIFTAVVGGSAAAGTLVLVTLVLTKLGRLRCQVALFDASTESGSKKGSMESHATHMDYFESTPEEDCFNYWSCLSTTCEAEAHRAAVIVSAPGTVTVNPDLVSVNSAVSINEPPGLQVPGARRTRSYGDLGPMLGTGGVSPLSSSVPTIIEYSDNDEQHHRNQNKRHAVSRGPLSLSGAGIEDTSPLVANEQLAEPTPVAPGPSTPSTLADVHAEPSNNGDVTPGGHVTPPAGGGSPYDNVQITVTPGGHILYPNSDPAS